MNAPQTYSNHTKHVSKKQQLRKKKLEAQQALFLLRKNTVLACSGVGCFLSSFKCFLLSIYFAAQYTDGVASSTFLHRSCSPSLLLVAFAGILYLQSLLSLHGVEDEMQREQLKKMIYMSLSWLSSSPSSHQPVWRFTGLSVVSWWFSNSSSLTMLSVQNSAKKFVKNLPKNPQKQVHFSTGGGRKDVTPNQATAIMTNKKHKNAMLVNNILENKERLSWEAKFLHQKARCLHQASFLSMNVSCNLGNFLYPSIPWHSWHGLLLEVWPLQANKESQVHATWILPSYDKVGFQTCQRFWGFYELPKFNQIFITVCQSWYENVGESKQASRYLIGTGHRPRCFIGFGLTILCSSLISLISRRTKSVTAMSLLNFSR